MSEVPKNAVRIPPLCDACQRRAVWHLNLSPSDPWRIALVEMNLLLFRAVVMEDRFAARCGKEPAERGVSEMSLVLAEIGCMACWLPEARTAALAVLADTTRERTAVADTVYGRKRHPLWPEKWYLDPATHERKGT